MALDGRGFFEIETAEGLRSTRNGQFSRRPDGTIVTADGAIVRGDGGGPIVVGQGAIAFEPDGSVWAGGVLAGKLKVVDFGDYVGLRREGGHFHPEAGLAPTTVPETSRVRGGALEASNVQLPEGLSAVESIQRNGKAAPINSTAPAP